MDMQCKLFKIILYDVQTNKSNCEIKTIYFTNCILTLYKLMGKKGKFSYQFHNRVIPSNKVRRLSSNVKKGAKIRNRYNQVPHQPQDTNGKVTNSK